MRGTQATLGDDRVVRKRPKDMDVVSFEESKYNIRVVGSEILIGIWRGEGVLIEHMVCCVYLEYKNYLPGLGSFGRFVA